MKPNSGTVFNSPTSAALSPTSRLKGQVGMVACQYSLEALLLMLDSCTNRLAFQTGKVLLKPAPHPAAPELAQVWHGRHNFSQVEPEVPSSSLLPQLQCEILQALQPPDGAV